MSWCGKLAFGVEEMKKVSLAQPKKPVPAKPASGKANQARPTSLTGASAPRHNAVTVMSMFADVDEIRKTLDPEVATSRTAEARASKNLSKRT